MSVWPRPSAEDFGRLYRDYYTQRPAPEAGWFKKTVKRIVYWEPESFAGRACYQLMLAIGGPTLREVIEGRRMWLNLRGGEADVLDVGCGRGELVAHMRQRGWRVVGVEPDPRAAASAKQIYGVEVYCGFLEDVAFDAGRFAAVTANHVIEHVEDPVSFVAECLRVTRPDGEVVLTTPNAKSLGRTVFGPGWRGLEVPRHLQVFSARGLREVIDRAGGTVREMRVLSRSSAWVWRESRSASVWSRLLQVGIVGGWIQWMLGVARVPVGEELMVRIGRR